MARKRAAAPAGRPTCSYNLSAPAHSRLAGPSSLQAAYSSLHRTGPAPTPNFAAVPAATYAHHPPAADLEVFDLTEDLETSPTPSHAPVVRLGRKRKSEEISENIPRQVRTPTERGSPTLRGSPTGNRSDRIRYEAKRSAKFADVDDIVEHPLEPPPPYSTVPRNAVRSPTNLPTSSSTLSHQDLNRTIVDSEDDAEETDHVPSLHDNYAARVKDSRQRTNHASSGEEVPTYHQVRLEEGHVKKMQEQNFTATTGISESLPSNKTQPVDTTPDGRVVSSAPQDKILLRAFLIYPDANLKKQLSVCRADVDAMIEAAYESIDETGKPAQDLLDQMKQVQAKAKSIEELIALKEELSSLMQRKDNLKAQI
ncbi:hypothetical protein LTR28_001427, partial [Elasticomyces elasticus]